MGRGPMPIHERLILSPWAKWRKHGRIPWKFIIHLVLAVLVTVQVVYLNETSDYVDRTQASMLSMFVHPKLELVNRGPRGGQVYIYTYEDFANSLTYKVRNFYDIQKFVGEFHTVGVPEMYVNYDNSYMNDTAPVAQKYDLRSPPYGPFHTGNNTQMREVVGKMATAEVIMNIHSIEPARPEVRKSPVCWEWRIHALYDFTSHARINLNFAMTWELGGISPLTLCGRMNEQALVVYRPHVTAFWIGVAVIFFATISLLLSLRSMHRSLQVYYLARRHYCEAAAQHGQQFSFWNLLSFYDKLRFFNLWMIVTFVHSILCILSSMLYLFPSFTRDIHTHWWVHFSMGLASALGWIHVTQYFEHDKELSVFLLALRTGFPYILRLVVAMGPVFFGYSLFGWTFFGAFTPSFQTLGASMVSLFCIINGDDIHMTFRQFVREDQFIGRLYLTSFVIFFVYCVFNIFIYIMEDAIHNVKIMSRKHEMPGGSIFPKAPDNILDNDALKEMLRPINSDGDDALGERSRRSRDRLTAIAQSHGVPPLPSSDSDLKLAASRSSFFSGRFLNKPGFPYSNSTGAEVASFDQGEARNSESGSREGGGRASISPRLSLLPELNMKGMEISPNVSFCETVGSSASLQQLWRGPSGGSADEGLREPLLGSHGEGEGAEERGVMPGRRDLMEMQSAGDVHRMAVLEQLFHAQERVQRQHLESFKESLAEIAEEHQNMLQESNRLFMEAMDKRLRKIFTVPSTTNNNLTSPPILSRPSSPSPPFSMFFGGNPKPPGTPSGAPPPSRTLSGGRNSAASLLFPSLNRRNTLAGPEVERAARRAVEATASFTASPPIPPRRASSSARSPTPSFNSTATALQGSRDNSSPEITEPPPGSPSSVP